MCINDKDQSLRIREIDLELSSGNQQIIPTACVQMLTEYTESIYYLQFPHPGCLQLEAALLKSLPTDTSQFLLMLQ